MTADKALARSASESRLHRSIGASIDGARHVDDFYPTPPPATRALLSVERFYEYVWEPACGDGAISKVLEENGHNVLSTDLNSYGYGKSGVDFLMETKPRSCDIITNPPFKLLLPFIEKSLAVSNGKVAMLVRITALEGIKRSKFLKSSPLKSVYIFSRRLTFNRGGSNETHGGGMLAFCWFVWDKSHIGKAEIDWIDWKDFE